MMFFFKKNYKTKFSTSLILKKKSTKIIFEINTKTKKNKKKRRQSWEKNKKKICKAQKKEKKTKKNVGKKTKID